MPEKEQKITKMEVPQAQTVNIPEEIAKLRRALNNVLADATRILPLMCVAPELKRFADVYMDASEQQIALADQELASRPGGET